MSKTVETKITWTCDRCGTQKDGGKGKPSTADDAWSYLRLDQDAGWDFHGHPWAPRMRDKVLLCGKCTEEIVQMVNGFHIRFDGPPGHDAGRFVEVETLEGKGLGLGGWKQDGEYWLLAFPEKVGGPEDAKD